MANRNTIEDRFRNALARSSHKFTRVERRSGGTQVVFEEGCSEYCVTRHLDDKWRWNSTRTYGNYGAMYGIGCDASGFVLTAKDIIIALEKLAAERA